MTTVVPIRSGNDIVVARDRNVDLIACGPGSDRAVVDRRDIVAGCERTERPRRQP